MTEITDRLGEIRTDGDAVTLCYQRRLNHPPAKVWRALTESEHLAHWFPADIVGERVAGADLRLPFWPESVERATEELEQAGVDLADPALPGKLLTWDPPKVFEFSWDAERLRFELEPEGDGTRLVFTCAIGPYAGPRGVAGTAAGFHLCLDSLEELLDSGASALPDPSRVGNLEQQYAALATTPE